MSEIQDGNAITLLQQIQRRVVQVAVRQSTTAIATAYAHYTPYSSTPVLNTIPILLLHGFDSSLLEFRRLLPLLAQRHEAWAIDLLGSGFTEYTTTLAVNPQTIRQHLFNVIKDWIGQPVILVGASLGGAVAIDFALHYPSWVRSLVLMDSVGFSGSFPVGQFIPGLLIGLGANWLYFRKHAALAAASVLPILDVSLMDALRCSLLHHEMPGWKDAIAAFTQSGGYANLSPTSISPRSSRITCCPLLSSLRDRSARGSRKSTNRQYPAPILIASNRESRDSVMPVEASIQIAPNLASVLLMLLGGAALLFPKTMAAFVGLGSIAPVGISEIRSTLGSFFLGLGAACLWLQSTDAFTVLGVASLVAVAVRLISSIVDRSTTLKNIGGVVAKACFGGFVLVPLDLAGLSWN